MKTLIQRTLALALLAMAVAPIVAHADPSNNVAGTFGVCDPTTGSGKNCIKPNADGSINANTTTTITGFTPNGSYGTPLSATNTTSRQALPTGTAVLVENTSQTVPAYVNLGNGSVNATTAQIYVPPGGGCVLTVGANTNVAGITASSTATLNLVGGAGLGSTCFGGGSGGSSGSVTIGAPLGSSLSAVSVAVVIASDQGAVAMKIASGQIASGAVASGAFSSGAFASGAFSSGSYASGAFASGAFAIGSIASGADVVEGTITSAHTCSTAGYTVIGCEGQADDDIKLAVTALNTLITNSTTPLPAQASPGVDIGAVEPIAKASGSGLTLPFNNTLTNSATAIDSNTGGQMYAYALSNMASGNTACVIEFWDVSTSPTLGTTAVNFWHIGLSAGASANLSFDTPLMASNKIYAAAVTVLGGSTACGGVVDAAVAVK